MVLELLEFSINESLPVDLTSLLCPYILYAMLLAGLFPPIFFSCCCLIRCSASPSLQSKKIYFLFLVFSICAFQMIMDDLTPYAAKHFPSNCNDLSG